MATRTEYKTKVSLQGKPGQEILRGRLPTPMILALGAQDQDELVFIITGPGTLEVYNNGPAQVQPAKQKKAKQTAAPAPAPVPAGQPPRRRVAPTATVPTTMAPQQPVATPVGQPPRRRATAPPAAAAPRQARQPQPPLEKPSQKRKRIAAAAGSGEYAVPGFD